MGIADWDQGDIEQLEEGLSLLGWRSDARLTSDDAVMLRKVADEAVRMSAGGLLTPDEIDRLSLEAFDVLHFQIMNIEERAMKVSSTYSESPYLSTLNPMIEQSLLCYYRGYFTASLAMQFIVLENYLRGLLGWKPSDKNPSFPKLRRAIYNLPKSGSRDEAQRIIDIVYARYDAGDPPQFLFNRHGLFHGLREGFRMDRLNCVRMCLLFDSLAAAEGYTGGGQITDLFRSRKKAYLECKNLSEERAILYPE
jgi:hypothetical protein